MDRADTMMYLLRVLIGNSVADIAFIKRGDGSLRKMRCKLRSPESDDVNNELLAVYDLEKRADRRIPTDSIIRLVVGELSLPLVGRQWDNVITGDPELDFLTPERLSRVQLIKWNHGHSKAFLRPITE